MLTDSDLWFNTKKEDMLRMNWIGDSIPNIRIDFGPTALGTLIGSQFHFESDTTWFTPSISNDWSNATAWSIDENDKWWRIMCGLVERVAADAAGRYLLCTPAYEASADVVLNLRGTSEFCMDIIDRPQKISQSIDALFPCWQKTLKMLYDTSIRQGTGLTTWMRIWSNEPFAIVAADVGYMLSPEDFKKVILPSLAREAAKIARAIFHIDGPPMWRHIDALLEIPEIRAIQFTPGAGTPSIMPYIDIFRKIQSAGRSLLIFASPNEVMPLCKAIKPEGLAILLDVVPPANELQMLFDEMCRYYGRSSK
jgi:hypothetical protein